MVLAFAALLLQFSAAPQTTISQAKDTSTSSITLTNGTDSPETGNSGVAESDATPTHVDDGDTHSAKPAVDPSGAFRSVRLGPAPNSSATDGPALKDVAMDSNQMSQSFSTIRVPEVKGTQNNKIEEVRAPSRRSWLALAFAEHAAAGLDAYSTRLAVSRGAVEDDPLMRPFAHSDAIYVASQVGPLLFDYIARRMQRSDNLTLRKFWWVPQSASTGVSLFAGVHNIHVANSISK